MESVLRGAAIYVFLLVIMRISGKRSFAEITTFDFVLLLVIGETTQQALLGEDFSLTNAFIVIATLVGIDIALSLWKQRSKSFARLLEGRPLVLVADGELLKDRMDEVRVDVDDILAAGRELQGLERLDQIKYAVLERNGGISIIPRER
ncbi:membrane protein [Sulfurifustis variabilis]|uniref:Membrane protein n=1 Tax=Sulfurifustis variabilis TaxID=1675686 RepID=A0A1C7AFT4_9GAMM|nr:YetF domain-containing protein [Sulfurifustis variabilis]BAU50258.1 membrane protein [Sulfurifustis variabilis]